MPLHASISMLYSIVHVIVVVSLIFPRPGSLVELSYSLYYLGRKENKVDCSAVYTRSTHRYEAHDHMYYIVVYTAGYIIPSASDQ